MSILSKIKEFFFGKEKEDEVAITPNPIEINPTEVRVLSRKEARLQRLLTIENPSKALQQEIRQLQKEIN